jgi:hypothetical protein
MKEYECWPCQKITTTKNVPLRIGPFCLDNQVSTISENEHYFTRSWRMWGCNSEERRESLYHLCGFAIAQML